MTITLVAAVARNGVIGRAGSLPWRLPDDLARFKRLTLGGTVVMGRKTHASIGRALPGRTNLVLSRTAGPIAGCQVVRSVDEALAAAHGEALFVIGGAEVYRAFLPIAHRLELTEVDAEVAGDVHFPELDRAGWRVVREEAHPADERHEYPFRFVTYERSPG